MIRKYGGKIYAGAEAYMNKDDDRAGGTGPTFGTKWPGSEGENGDQCNNVYGKTLSAYFNTNNPQCGSNNCLNDPAGAAGPLWTTATSGSKVLAVNANVFIGNAGYPEVNPYYQIQSMYDPVKSQCVSGTKDYIELKETTYQFNFFNAVNDGNNYVLNVVINTIHNFAQKPAPTLKAVPYGKGVTYTKVIKGATTIASLDIYKVVGTTYTLVLSSKQPRLAGFQLDSRMTNALIVLAQDPKGRYITPVMGFGPPNPKTSTWMGVNLQYPNTNEDKTISKDNPWPVTFDIVPPPGTTKGKLFNDAMTYAGILNNVKYSATSYSFGTYQHSDTTPQNLNGYGVTLTSKIEGQAQVGPITLSPTCAVPGCISYTLFLPDGKQYNWQPDTTTTEPHSVMGNVNAAIEGIGTFPPVPAPTMDPTTLCSLKKGITWVYGKSGENCDSACNRYHEQDCDEEGTWPTTEAEFNCFGLSPVVPVNFVEGDENPPPPVPSKVCVAPTDAAPTAAPRAARKHMLEGAKLDDHHDDTTSSSASEAWDVVTGAPPADPFSGDIDHYSKPFFPAFSYYAGVTADCKTGTIFVGRGKGKCKAKYEYFTRYCPCKKDPTKKEKPTPVGKPTPKPTKHHLRKTA